MFLFLLWTQTPLALVMAAYSRSVPTAVAGLMPNQSRIGVINEPPPTPVMPTMKPTMRPAMVKPNEPTSIIYLNAQRARDRMAASIKVFL
ncbi:hypothetical protein D3C77_619890 [compost metagenome]